MAAKFYIQSDQTKLAMTLKDDNNGAGTHIVMQPFVNRNSQLFTYVNDCIFSVLSPSLVLDIEGKKGPNVIIFPSNSKSTQQWKFNDDGTITNKGEKLNLDVNGGSTSPGTNVILWKKNKSPNQQFTVVYV